MAQKRNADPRQIRALQAAYGALNKSDDVRVFIGVHEDGRTDREQRIIWARMQIGRHNIHSFSDLSEAEANYLLDYCNGTQTKLDARIAVEMNRLGVRSPSLYFDQCCRPLIAETRNTRNIWTFGGRSFNGLNFIDKYNLVNILATRMPAQVPAEVGA